MSEENIKIYLHDEPGEISFVQDGKISRINILGPSVHAPLTSSMREQNAPPTWQLVIVGLCVVAGLAVLFSFADLGRPMTVSDFLMLAPLMQPR